VKAQDGYLHYKKYCPPISYNTISTIHHTGDHSHMHTHTHTHMRSLIYGTGMYCKRVCKPFRSTATNTCRQTLTSTHLNR